MTGAPVKARISVGGIETLTDSPGSYENRGMAIMRDQGVNVDFITGFELMTVPRAEESEKQSRSLIDLNSWLDARNWYLARTSIAYNTSGAGTNEDIRVGSRLRITGDLYVPRQNLVSVLDIEISEAQR